MAMKKIVLSVCAAVFAAGSAWAGNYVWTGGGGSKDTSWETPANWSVDGNTLTITSFEHKDGAGWDPGATVDDSAGGEIVWKRPNGLLIYVK